MVVSGVEGMSLAGGAVLGGGAYLEDVVTHWRCALESLPAPPHLPLLPGHHDVKAPAVSPSHGDGVSHYRTQEILLTLKLFLPGIRHSEGEPTPGPSSCCAEDQS